VSANELDLGVPNGLSGWVWLVGLGCALEKIKNKMDCRFGCTFLKTKKKKKKKKK
jgi:hypothetical protein